MALPISALDAFRIEQIIADLKCRAEMLAVSFERCTLGFARPTEIAPISHAAVMSWPVFIACNRMTSGNCRLGTRTELARFEIENLAADHSDGAGRDRQSMHEFGPHARIAMFFAVR